MALKDRLEARRRPEAGHPVLVDTTLSVLAGAREEPKAPTPAVREEAVPKSAGLTTTLAAAKAAIHAQLVERHADEIDITAREGVRSRMTIRKFSRDKLRPADLLTIGSASPEMIEFLRIAVRSRLSILVSGGTSSGKTTLLNILSSFIPADERIVTVEDSAELQLRQKHVIRLESRPPNVEGKGAIEIRDLVRNALRMRPDRIIVGECRGGEALDMLQAMNTGHEGSMSTVHANSPYDAFGRLETMVLMGGADLPARAIQKQIASAIDLVVQVERVRGGQRKIVSVVEITGLTNGEMEYQELFQFRQSGVDHEGNAIGAHVPTGHLSKHMDHFVERGESVGPSIFEPAMVLA